MSDQDRRRWTDESKPCPIMEVLGMNGPGFSTGGACAAGNIALRTAMDEIRHHDSDAALVVAGFHELTPASLHSLARLKVVLQRDERIN